MKWFSAFRGKLHSMRTVVFFSVLLIPQNSRHPVLVIGTATQYCLPLLSLFLFTHYHEYIGTFAAAASAAPTAALFRKDSSQ